MSGMRDVAAATLKAQAEGNTSASPTAAPTTATATTYDMRYVRTELVTRKWIVLSWTRPRPQQHQQQQQQEDSSSSFAHPPPSSSSDGASHRGEGGVATSYSTSSTATATAPIPPTATVVATSSSSSSVKLRWKYILEWSDRREAGSHRIETTFCHAIIPVEFSDDAISVRVSATGFGPNSIVMAQSEIEMSVLTSARTPLLWEKWWTSGFLKKDHITTNHFVSSNKKKRNGGDSSNTARVPLDSYIVSHFLQQAPSKCVSSISASLGIAHDLSSTQPPRVIGVGIVRGSPMLALEVNYAQLQLPMKKRRIVYLVVCKDEKKIVAAATGGGKTKSTPDEVEKLTHETITQLVSEDDVALVVCSEENAAVDASLAAHRIIASLLNFSTSATSHEAPIWKERAEKVFGVFFSPPCQEFFKEGLVLTGTCTYSGQFLFVYGSSQEQELSRMSVTRTGSGGSFSPMRRQSGDLNSSSPHQGASNGGASASGSTSAPLSAPRFNSLPIGGILNILEETPSDQIPKFSVELAPVGSTCQEYAQHQSSSTLTKDIYQLLTNVASVCLSRPKQEIVASLAPTLDDVHVGVVDGTVVKLSIKGRNVCLEPSITIWPNEQIPIAIQSEDVKCDRSMTVSCELALLKLVVWGTFKNSVKMRMALSTRYGYIASRSLTLRIPRELLRMIKPTQVPNAGAGKSVWPTSWMYGGPAELITQAIVLEPLHTAAAGSFFPGGATKALTALEHIANIAQANIPKASLTSSIFSRMASKVYSNNSTPTTLVPSTERPEIFTRLLDMHIRSKREVMSLQSQTNQWKMKLFQSMAWFEEEKYEAKLRSFVALLSPDRRSPDISLSMLECLLYTRIVRLLRGEGHTRVNFSEPLSAAISFDSFYPIAWKVILEGNPEQSAADIVSDCIALWSCCIVHNLRSFQILNQVVAVCGVQGSGLSSIANQVKVALRDAELDQQDGGSGNIDDYNHSVVIRESEVFDNVLNGLHLGVPMVVVYVVEVWDVEAGTSQSKVWDAIKELKSSMSAPKRQHVVLVVNKLDEKFSQETFSDKDGEKGGIVGAIHNCEEEVLNGVMEEIRQAVDQLHIMAVNTNKGGLLRYLGSNEVEQIWKYLEGSAEEKIEDAVDLSLVS